MYKKMHIIYAMIISQREKEHTLCHQKTIMNPDIQWKD